MSWLSGGLANLAKQSVGKLNDGLDRLAVASGALSDPEETLHVSSLRHPEPAVPQDIDLDEDEDLEELCSDQEAEVPPASHRATPLTVCRTDPAIAKTALGPAGNPPPSDRRD